MSFDADAFISYAHMDNVELIEGCKKAGLPTCIVHLEVRVGQLLGKQPHIWRDPKLQGNDLFEDTLIQPPAAGRRAGLGGVAAVREVGMDSQGAGRVLRGRQKSGGRLHNATKPAFLKC